MFNIKIDDKEYQVDENVTIIEACNKIGIKIPRFCYNEKLSVPANCRMCLVEVKGMPKPVPSCRTKVTEGMEIFINSSPKVKEIRKSVIELLLINHPLDCPICDKGGECELQNQTAAYGLNKGNFEFSKRVVEDKDLGPLIYTSFTRCIDCTRCIRFLDEIAGEESLSMLGRGGNVEISNYFSAPILSELSGNIVDLCPVGALNNTQYKYKARPWQLVTNKTIDIMEVVCPEIEVNTYEDNILRILPAKVEGKETFIADKTRYMVDGLRTQRLDIPYIRKDNKLMKATWEEAFSEIYQKLNKLNGNQIAALSGGFSDCETNVLLKELFLKLGSSNIDCRVDGINFLSDKRSSFIFNTKESDIDEVDTILIVGSNPKIESPLLNLKIRERVLKGNVKVATVGKKIKLNYESIHLGESLQIVNDLTAEKHDFAKELKNSKKIMLIVGEGAFEGRDFNKVSLLLNSFIAKFNIINESYNGYNLLTTSTSKISALYMGFTPENKDLDVNKIISKCVTEEIKLLWILDVDNIDFTKLENTFIVYQGHHGDKGAEHADVILPGALWLEKESSFVDIKGKLRTSKVVCPLPGQAKEDWKIIKSFSDFIGKPLAVNSLEEVRNKVEYLYNLNNHIDNNQIIDKIDIDNIPIKSSITDYYVNDVISKNSETLLKCSKIFTKERLKMEGIL